MRWFVNILAIFLGRPVAVDWALAKAKYQEKHQKRKFNVGLAKLYLCADYYRPCDLIFRIA